MNAVALLTDFGTRDPYVGALRGAAHAAAAKAGRPVHVTDITHRLAPGDIWGGAYALFSAAPAYPAGSAFAAVVDPGVGTARKAIAVQAGGHYYTGPDNGLLAFLWTPWLYPLNEYAPPAVRELQNPWFFREVVSHTFHGRDIFGPADALSLARGARVELARPGQHPA